MHISEHNKKLKCKFCEKMFGNQTRLKVHLRHYHENPKEYICNICGKKCTLQSNLNSHMKSHDPNRQQDFKCTQCDYATFNGKSFEFHLNSHKKRNAKIAAMENPHKCSQCSSGFNSKRALDSHMSRVHPKVLLECDICGKEIKIKTSLLSHFRLFHKIKSDVGRHQV